jgi:subfamily B ATP-binding cassette protein MsbA
VIRELALPLGFLRRQRALVARFVATSLGRAALTAFTILLIREFLAGVLGQGTGLAREVARTHGAGFALWTVVGLVILAHLGATALAYDTQVTEQKIVKVIELGTMERLIRHLLALSVGFFDRRTHGDLIQAVRQDVSEMRTAALAGANMLLEAFQAACLIGAAIALSRSLALWAFLIVPLAIAPIYLIARRTLTRAFGVRRKGVILFDILLQLLRGIRIIKLYQGEHAEAERTIDRARLYFDELIAMERVRALARVVLESLGGLSLVAVIVVGGFQVMSGTLGWPELLAFLMAARAAQGPLNNVSTGYMEIQRHGASVAHIDALLQERPEIRDLPNASPLVRAPSSIAAHRLGFAFGDNVVLRDISFEVCADEILGVVGPSGAGKTTLLSLIARFYDPTSGAVLFDGDDIRSLRLADVHGSIAIVTQDPFLFSATIRDNIRCGRATASDSEVEIAARAAEIHDDIVAMPTGYDTVVGHGGRDLSRGEAQRVNVARAILKDAPILLLDEATSSLDSYAEAKVQRAIDRLVSGRVTISVAHRMSTLRNATRILVLEGGRAVGLGTHDDLLDRCPTYLRLWEAQTGSAFTPNEELTPSAGEAAGR